MAKSIITSNDTDRFSRRDFLRVTGAALGTLIGGPLISACQNATTSKDHGEGIFRAKDKSMHEYELQESIGAKGLTSPVIKKIDIHNHIWIPNDPDGARLIVNMDRMGIERMVVHACDTRIWSYVEGNEGVAQAVKKHPDRFIGTVCLDFRAGVDQCIELIRWAAGEGLKGAKMFPNLGFYPDDPSYYGIYEELARHRFFAAFHMGVLAQSDVNPRIQMSTKYATPFFLEEPAIRFPELGFVVCHMGGIPGMEETLVVTRFYENIYADLGPGYGVESFKHMGSRVSLVDWKKFMWGTDQPDEYVDDAWSKNLAFWGENARQLNYEDKLPMLLHENAANFLRRYSS